MKMETKTKAKTNIILRKHLFVYGLLFLPVLWAAVFIVYANFSTIFLSFNRYGFGKTFSFYNYRRLWFDLKNTDSWRVSVKNSLLYFVVNLCIAFPLAIVFSYMIFKKIPLGKTFRALFFFPGIISVVALVLVYRYTFDANPKIGMVTNLLIQVLGVDAAKVPMFLTDPKYAMSMVYIFTVWSGLGYNIILLSGAMSRIPPEITESAAIDGAGPVRELCVVMIPLIWPTLSVLLITSPTIIFGMFLHPMLVTPAGDISQTYTFAWLMFNEVTRNINYAAAIGVAFAVVGIACVMTIKFLTERVFQDIDF